MPLTFQGQDKSLNVEDLDYFELAALQYFTGYQNRSNYWVVVTAVNNEDFTSKKVCVNMKDLRSFLLHTFDWEVLDSNVVSQVDSIILTNTKREFYYDPNDKINKFPNLNLYDDNELFAIKESINLDSMSIRLQDVGDKYINTTDEKEMCMLAHVLSDSDINVYEYSCSGSLLWKVDIKKMRDNVSTSRLDRLKKTIHNSGHKANANDRVNLKRNATNKR